MTTTSRTPGDVADQLFRVAHIMRRSTRRIFAPLGLTPSQERALRLVARAGRPLRMGELAERMGIVPRSATDLVGRLELDRLVERATDPDNRRSVLVTLASKGAELQAAMTAARHEAAAELLAPLTGEQQAQLGALLDVIVAGSAFRSAAPSGTVEK